MSGERRVTAVTVGAMEGSMNYCESAASPDLAHIILSYWEFVVTCEVNGPFVHEVYPDGCVTLAYRRDATGEVSWLRVVGPRLESIRTEVSGGDIFWGARLSPAACRAVLGHDPAGLRNQILPLSQLLPGADEKLFRQLNASGTFAQAIASYYSFLRSRGLTSADVDMEVAAAVKLIEASKGQAKVADVAAAVKLSARQLERRFRAVAGLTPKQFSRARRVRATAVTLVDGREMNWASRAAEMGFADQSHLTREIGAVTGRSPVTFAEDIAKIEHGKLVK